MVTPALVSVTQAFEPAQQVRAVVRAQTRLRKQPAAWPALFAFLIWDTNDATGPKGVPHAGAFLAVVAVFLGLAVLGRRTPRASIPRPVLGLVSVCLVLGLLMIPFRQDFHTFYVAQDLGTLLFFILCLLYASKFEAELMSKRTIIWFTAFYIFISVVAYYSATRDLRPAFAWNGRWDPPYFMLMGGLGLLIREARVWAAKIIGLALMSGLFWLGLESGNRTQFALGVVFVLLAWASSVKTLFAMLASAVGLLLTVQVGLLHANPFAGLFATSRFSLLNTGPDESLQGRLLEVSDIWHHMTVTDSPWQTFLGRGAGATWVPIKRVLEDNTGTAFYIHIGFANLSYRYGVFGFALFVYLVLKSFQCVRTLFFDGAGIGQRFWCLGALGFGLNYFLQDSFYDPPAVMAMAVVLVVGKRMWQRPGGEPGDKVRSTLVGRTLTTHGSPVVRGDVYEETIP